MFRKSLTIASLFGAALVANSVQAAISYTYTYDAATVANVTSAGDGSASEYNTPVMLNNGVLGSTDVPWDVGNGATLYGLDGDAHPQPGLTIDLGGVHNLTSLTIHYVHRETSAVWAPNSVDVTVGGNPSFQFTGFDDSPWSAGNVSRVAVIDLTGYTGSTIHLDFRNGTGNTHGTTPPGGSELYGQWTSLAEIVVDGAVVPEPASLALVAMGGLLMLRRRRD